MKIKITKETAGSIRGEIIAVGIFKSSKTTPGAASTINRLTDGKIKQVMNYGDFTGKLNETLVLYIEKGLRAKRILLVGLGAEKEFDIDKLRGAVSAAACRIRDMGLKSFVLPLSFVQKKGLLPQLKVKAFVEASILGLYTFEEFKTSAKKDIKNKISTLTILTTTSEEYNTARKQAVRSEAVARAACNARDLVSYPGNRATPEFLSARARSAAKKHGLTCKVFDKSKASKLGMGAFLSVAKGSSEPPAFIILEHKPKIKNAPVVVLVGKAITFDSGGISLKPPAGMEEMKMDMAGGAAVIGVLQASAEINLSVHVVGIVPAAENLPAGNALKPGDIVKSMSGKTIEIISTDAEGRLILCDALNYALKYKPAAIVDVATLTGACIIALGNNVSAIMGNSKKLIKKIESAGNAAGEKVWELPLWDEYDELIKSDIADIKNVGGRPAGTITAGCFLKEFVGSTPWVHIDIAGTAWSKNNKPCIPKGATGIGVRLLVEMLENW